MRKTLAAAVGVALVVVAAFSRPAESRPRYVDELCAAALGRGETWIEVGEVVYDCVGEIIEVHGDPPPRELEPPPPPPEPLPPPRDERDRFPAGGGASGKPSSGHARERVRERKFDSCQAAVEWLNRDGTRTGVANPQWGWGRPKKFKFKKRTDGTYEATVDEKPTYNARGSSTTVTKPSWPNMTAAENAAVRRYLDAVRGHERGHHNVAKGVLRKATKRITVRANTKDEVQEKLERKVDQHRSDTKRAVEEASKEYDKKTNHGRNQKAVGGRNIELTCPQGKSSGPTSRDRLPGKLTKPPVWEKKRPHR